MSIVWNTPSGLIASINKGESFLYGLECVGASAFSVIAGALPLGLSLSSPFNNPTLAFPSIWGTTSTLANTGIAVFTIRAIDSDGDILDRSFSLNVSDIEPSYVFPNANLGTFPDGLWMSTSVAPLVATPFYPRDMQIISGSLPEQIQLNPYTGNITGYVSPVVLYSSPLNQPNAESGAPELALSANTKVYNFTVQYDANNTSNFSLTVERQDLFQTGNCNVARPVYHDPIFLDAEYSANLVPRINLGTVAGDNILYQFDVEDFEGNTLGYTLINGNAVPGNISINAETGWLSGYIDRDLSNTTPYSFQVEAYKSANVFISPSYSTIANCILTVLNPADNSIVWNSGRCLGNLYTGIPSSLNINASIIEPFFAPSIIPATANCTLKLVDVIIISGGNAFANGSIFTVSGGVYDNPASIIVSNVSASGTITNVLIDPTVIQHYSVLPPSMTAVWTNQTGNANALNAIFGLSFGVDTVNVLDTGEFYDTATVGFTPAGANVSAEASVRILNGKVNNVVVDDTGKDYLGVPQVVILPKALITSTNPIKYTIVSGALPAGCELLSNGLLVGIPSSQYFPTNCNSYCQSFNFTVMASIGQNSSIEVKENDIAGNNIVTEDFQTLIQVNKEFVLYLTTTISNTQTPAPKTNLSLEFLLDDTDMETLYTPLRDESLVPNDSIYRQSDFYFGIVPHVRMLLAYGISPEIPSTVQCAINQYFSNKQYSFGNLQWAQSTSENYEVIYLEPLDQFSNANNQSFLGSVSYNTPNGVMQAYPPTTPNMINQLNTHLNGFDYGFLPSWMRDIQPDGQIIGYIPAIPLVFVQPGTGKKILFYLQQYYNNVGPNLNTIDAVTDRLVWNTGYSQNWDSRPRVVITSQNTTSNSNITANSFFTINSAVPDTFTPNLTPRTFEYSGNIVVNIPSNIGNVGNVVTIINNYLIPGIQAGIGPNNELQIQNIYGSPFLLYDGTNTPLANLELLPSGNLYANVNAITQATWWTFETTGVSYGESTSYIDIPVFIDTMDMFLNDDQGATYIKFANTSPIIGV